MKKRLSKKTKIEQQDGEPSFSVNQAARFWRKDRNLITSALLKSGLTVGKDCRFKIHEINGAIFGNAKLERDAKAAKHQQTIDEAAMVKAERELKEGQTVYRSAVRDRIADVFTKACQIVRQWDISEHKKKELIRTLADLKLDPPKVA